MVQEIKLNQIDTVVTTVGTPWTDGNIPTEKAVRDAIAAGGSSKFWGTGADGAIDGTTNVTITGSNDTYIVLLYTSDAADATPCVDLGGRRIIKKKNKNI